MVHAATVGAILVGGILVGYGLHHCGGARREGDVVWLMMRWEFDEYVLHLHHWLIYWWLLTGLVVLYHRQPYPGWVLPLAVGWCLGGLLQGLRYADWYYCIFPHYRNRFSNPLSCSGSSKQNPSTGAST